MNLSQSHASESLQHFLEEVEKLKESKGPISDQEFVRVLNIFQLYKTLGFADYTELMSKVRDAVTRFLTIKEYSFDAEQVLPFLNGYLEGRLDKTGFMFLGSSVELAVSLSLKNIVDEMEEADREQVTKLSDILRKIEGCKHVVANYIVNHATDEQLSIAAELAPTLDEDDQLWLEKAITHSRE